MKKEGLVINLFGSVGVYLDNEDITTKLSSKSVAIIMFLVANYNKKITREKISDLLWAEKYDNAGYNLRYNLWSIKKVIPKDSKNQELIVSNKEYCYINPEYEFEADIIKINQLEEKAISLFSIDDLLEIKNQFKGEFLEQMHIKDAEEFYEWILVNRVKYQKLYLNCLNQMYAFFKNGELYDQKIEILEEILSCNPYDEECHYNLMMEYIEQGERHKAISQYKKCDNILRAELNIGAKNKLKELYLKLINDEIDFGNSNYDVREIEVNKYSNKNIEYLCISQIIEQIITIEKELNVKIICKNAAQAFSNIILFEGGEEHILLHGHVNDIKIYSSLKNVLKKLNEKIKIKINIYNREKMDLKSKVFFEYFMGSEENLKDIINFSKKGCSL